MWLVLLSSRTYTEAYKFICELYDDNRANMFMEEPAKMNFDEPILTEWEAKRLDEIQEYDTIKNAKEDVEASGIKQTRIDTAQKMLKEK